MYQSEKNKLHSSELPTGPCAAGQSWLNFTPHTVISRCTEGRVTCVAGKEQEGHTWLLRAAMKGQPGPTATSAKIGQFQEIIGGFRQGVKKQKTKTMMFRVCSNLSIRVKKDPKENTAMNSWSTQNGINVPTRFFPEVRDFVLYSRLDSVHVHFKCIITTPSPDTTYQNHLIPAFV